MQASALDWVDGNATEDSVREIAQVLDSAKLLYLFESDTCVYLREVLNECVRLHPGLCVPHFDILHPVSDGGSYEPALLKIFHCIPDDIPERARASFAELVESNVTQIPIVSVEQLVTETLLWKRKNAETYRGRVEGFKEMMLEDIKGADEYFANSTPFHIGWLKGFLKANKVLTACNDGLSTEDAVNILKGIDLQQCPSVWLYIRAHEQRMRAGHPPTDNDVDDWFVLPVVSYTDLVLVDGGFRHFILCADGSLESKVFANVADAARVLSALAAPVNDT
jgi:hypothetical protein